MGLIGHELHRDRKDGFDQIRDLMYSEVFDTLDAGPNDEIDAVVALRVGPSRFKSTGVVVDDPTKVPEDRQDDVYIDSYTVVDYRIFRIGHKLVADGLKDDDEPWKQLMAMDEWGRSVGDVYVWVHRHAEGMAYPSPKDMSWIAALAAIDYSRGNTISRQFHSAMIVNRTEHAEVESPDYPIATTVPEIDGPVMERMVENMKRVMEIDEDDPLIVLSRQTNEIALALERAINDEDVDRATALQAQMTPLINEWSRMIEARGWEANGRGGMQRKAPSPTAPKPRNPLELPKMGETIEIKYLN